MRLSLDMIKNTEENAPFSKDQKQTIAYLTESL